MSSWEGAVVFCNRADPSLPSPGTPAYIAPGKFWGSEIYNSNRKGSETHEPLLTYARRCAPPRARWTEVMRMDGYGTPSDVFSFGLILLELVTGVSTRERFESIGVNVSTISSFHAAEKRLDLETITEEMKADEKIKGEQQRSLDFSLRKRGVGTAADAKRRNRPNTWSAAMENSRANVMSSALDAATEKSSRAVDRDKSKSKSKSKTQDPAKGVSALDALDLVRRCWADDPSTRPSMSEVVMELGAAADDWTLSMPSSARASARKKMKKRLSRARAKDAAKERVDGTEVEGDDDKIRVSIGPLQFSVRFVAPGDVEGEGGREGDRGGGGGGGEERETRLQKRTTTHAPRLNLSLTPYRSQTSLSPKPGLRGRAAATRLKR